MTGPVKFAKVNKDRRTAGAKRRQAFLDSYVQHRDIDVACEDAGIKRNTYRMWREQHPDFKHRIDEMRLDGRGSPDPDFKGGFAKFRQHYFGHHSPWFHLKAIHAYETTRAGNITLILWPPEHGKTTLFEDYACYRLALRPKFRFTVGSENQNLARKILGRVKSRLSSTGPALELVRKYGPFEPQLGHSRQPWGADYFNVFKKGDHDERDYSMVGLGIGSQIAGSRTDHLHVDDVTSLKNVNITEKIVEVFRQDWLTRPGERGRTTINGTRVAEGDFYEVLMDSFGPDLMRVIKLPAKVWNEMSGEFEPLWPYDPDTGQGYTMDMLDRLAEKVGDAAWSRNYMQNPLVAGDRTFTDTHIKAMLNPLRSVDDKAPGGTGLITIDPALGGHNVVMGMVMHEGKLKVVDWFDDVKFTTNEQILNRFEELLLRLETGGATRVTDCIVEENAFQKGLQSDRQLLRLADTHGFSIRGHLTNDNKYDESIGVASMARDCRLGLVELPYAGDARTQYQTSQMIDQLKRWRPYVRGNRLRQDLLMALWFGWILWRERRGGLSADAAQFNFGGLPYRPTNTGILVPGRRSA